MHKNLSNIFVYTFICKFWVKCKTLRQIKATKST